MKKILGWIITPMFFCTLAACNSGKNEDRAYSFTGETKVEADGRSIVLEDTPDNYAEDVIVKEFLYTITREFDKKYDILANIEPHAISIENEKENMKEDNYIKSYVIHEIITLEEGQYSQEQTSDGAKNPLFYWGLQDIIETYKLTDYEVVSVNFTMLHSQKANEMLPQWSDGTYRRSFIAGKTSADKAYRIYDFGMM